MTEKYCADWKERIEFLIPLFLKQIEDSHKSSDIVIKRCYHLLYLNAIFAFLVLQISHDAMVLIGLVFTLIILVVSLKDALSTFGHMNQGLKPCVVELSKEYDGENVYLDLGNGYVIHEETSISHFYAWVIDSLDRQLQNSLQNGERLSKAYKEAQIVSIMSIMGIISLIVRSY